MDGITIPELHDGMLNGSLTSRTLVESCLDRIDRYDAKGPQIQAVITTNPNALKTADLLDMEREETGALRPLHGIPVLLKDNMCETEMPTTNGSMVFRNYRAGFDAFLVARLKEAGAIVLAKMNLHELATSGETVSSLGGQTRNPYDLTRTPGGSSGGSAAGVASGFGVVGLGTGTVNSIRSPASACSVVGFRPTVGLVSRAGLFPNSLTQDTAGILSTNVENAVLVLKVIAGRDPDDSGTSLQSDEYRDKVLRFPRRLDTSRLRIGVLRSFFGSGSEHREVNAVIGQYLDAMRQSGVDVFDLSERIDPNELIEKHMIQMYELKRDLNVFYREHQQGMPVASFDELLGSGGHHPTIVPLLELGASLYSKETEYRERLESRTRLQMNMEKIFRQNRIDAIVYPHQMRLPVPIGERQAERNGVLAAVTGFPACVIPAGYSDPTVNAPIGVPVGIEFFGLPWSDMHLADLAYTLQQIYPTRKPPVLD